jgi:uncharacterized membrane protein YgcG
MMSYTRWISLILSCAIMLILLLPEAVSAQDLRDFPLPQGIVTDFTGTLNETQMNAIRQALEQAHRANSMDGHVIITLSTGEWHLDEYVKDYADFLQGRDIINSTGWLLYISTADRKFALSVQGAALDSFTQQHQQEIKLILSEKLEQDDLTGAIIDAIDAIAILPPPEDMSEQRKVSPDMLVFMGIAIMVIALMLRLRTIRRKPQLSR